jgi:hypothetical protein
MKNSPGVSAVVGDGRDAVLVRLGGSGGDADDVFDFRFGDAEVVGDVGERVTGFAAKGPQRHPRVLQM